jgi:hypothetical protein
MPEVLKNNPKPALAVSLVPYLKALGDLSGERKHDNGFVHVIPWTAKLAWAEAYGVQDIEFFIDVLTEVDNFSVSEINRKHEETMKKGKK